MFSRIGLAATVFAVSLGVSAAQAVTTIDFDGLADGTFVDTQFAGDGVVFSSTGGGVRLFAFAGADTAPNGFVGTNGAGVLDSNELAEFSFFIGARVATTDFVSVAFTDLQLTGNSLTAFDVDGGQLGQVLAPCAVDFTCGSKIQIVSLNAPGIHRVVLDGAGGRGQGDVVFDTVTFGDLTLEPVPVPAALPLALTGVALMGFLGRRRRRAD